MSDGPPRRHTDQQNSSRQTGKGSRDAPGQAVTTIREPRFACLTEDQVDQLDAAVALAAAWT